MADDINERLAQARADHERATGQHAMAVKRVEDLHNNMKQLEGYVIALQHMGAEDNQNGQVPQGDPQPEAVPEPA